MIGWDSDEIERLADDLGQAATRVGEHVKAAVAKNEHDVMATARQRVPVDTGFLKSSISADTDADGLGYEIGPTATYGGFVEWGTSRMAPQPYLLPSFEQHLPTAYADLEQAVSRILD